MKNISLPGLFNSYRHEHALLQNELEAIHGGGVARFSLFFDVRKIYRAIAPSASDVFGHYCYGKIFSQFDIPAVLETRMISDFSALRNVHRIDLWNQFSVRLYIPDCYRWSPQDEFGDLGTQRLEGVYSQSVAFQHDLKGRYEIPSLGFYDSLFTGTQTLYPGRFSLSRGNQKTRYLSSFDTFRIWTRGDCLFWYDKYNGAADLYLGRMDAVLDVEQWPKRFEDRASNLIPNPLTQRSLYLLKRDQNDIYPWDRRLFLYDAFLYYFNEYPLHRQAFVRPGWRIMAKNLETALILELGFIDADQSDRSLENISLPNGDYEISVLTSSLFWKDTMDGNVRTISVRPGEEVSPLPVIYNLRSSVSFGTRTIQWSASHSEIDECLFGIWYSSETPVETNRTPDATVWYSASMTEFQTSFAQNAPAWVAVAAMRLDEENQIGKVHELYLDWSSVPPKAPDDVIVLAEPLPAIDSEILERPLEETDLSLVF